MNCYLAAVRVATARLGKKNEAHEGDAPAGRGVDGGEEQAGSGSDDSNPSASGAARWRPELQPGPEMSGSNGDLQL